MTEHNVSSVESLTDEKAKAAAVKFAEQVKEAYTRKFTFLLIGRTGVGKSSTINKLLGEEIAPVGEFEPETMSVKEYRLPINNVYFEVIDTPGLCDDLPQKGNDADYIQQIKRKVEYIDCVLYVTQLSETRVRNDEKYGIQLITSAFGKEIWDNSVLVFTFADQVNSEKYQYTLEKRTELISKVIEENSSSKIAKNIPSVAVSNVAEQTPDGNSWFGELYTTVVERISDAGFVQYLMATAPTVEPAKDAEDGSQTIVEEHHYHYYRQPSPSEKSKQKTSRTLTKKQQERLTNEGKRRGLGEQVISAVSQVINEAANLVRSGWNSIKKLWGG